MKLSKKLQNSTIVILSAYKLGLSLKQNDKRTDTLYTCLIDLKIPFLPALGYYKGNDEKSVICFVSDSSEIEILKQLAFNSFDQESILIQRDSSSYLLYQNNDTYKLGKYQELKSYTDNCTIVSNTIFTYSPIN